MSREILEELRARAAFKPKPPDYELAMAHVRVADVGIAHAIDERVANSMTTDDEAFVLVIGPPGSGKSSLLTASAAAVRSPDKPPHPLPLKVPVAHHTAEVTPELLVKAIAQSLAYELRGQLKDSDRRKLERTLATSIANVRQPGGLSGSLSVVLPPVKASISAAMGKDLLTLTTNIDWQGGGPIPSLLALRDLAASYEARLVVIFDDTDVWSVGDENMAARARAFFSAVRVLLDCPEVSIIVSVQTHWTETSSNAGSRTNAARREYAELAERAGALLAVPLPASKVQGRKLMKAIIDRRVEIVLDQVPSPRGGWCKALFTADALDLLASRCLSRSIRRAISDIRDAFDHLDVMPDQIGRQHLIDVIDD